MPAALPRRVVAAYATGHFFNDACASVWFSYLLVYLTEARGLSGVEAGAVLFAGQIADGLATPLAGVLSDRGGARWLERFGLGRRKFWHLVGTCTVVAAFFLLFGTCVACDVAGNDASEGGKAATFALAASVFNVGWAFVQVSHMALVPDLTSAEDERVLLNSARYAASIVANLLVFVTMLGLLGESGDASQSASLLAGAYEKLTLVVLAVGCGASALFLVGTPEHTRCSGGVAAAQPLLSLGGGDGGGGSRGGGAAAKPAGSPATDGGGRAPLGGGGERPPPTATGALGADGTPWSFQAAAAAADAEAPLPPPGAAAGAAGGARLTVDVGGGDSGSDDAEAGGAGGAAPACVMDDTPMSWHHWLRQPSFWVVAGVYMLTRLATNISQVYLSLYVRQALLMPPIAIALVPLLVFVASLGAAVGMKRLTTSLGWLWAFGVGTAAVALACGGMLLATPHTAWLAYPSALLLGVGVAVVSVLSVSAEADLIGPYTESGAFVYGAISLTDKLSNGIAVLAIQSLGNRISAPAAHGNFVRYVNSLVPLGAILLALLVATRLSAMPPPAPSPATPGRRSRHSGTAGAGGVGFRGTPSPSSASGGDGGGGFRVARGGAGKKPKGATAAPPGSSHELLTVSLLRGDEKAR